MNKYMSFIVTHYEPDTFFTTEELYIDYCSLNPDNDIKINAIQSALSRICNYSSSLIEKTGVGQYHYLGEEYISPSIVADMLQEEYKIELGRFDFIYPIDQKHFVFLASPQSFDLISAPSINPNYKKLQTEEFSIEVILPKVIMSPSNWTSVLFIELLYTFDRYHSKEYAFTNFPLRMRPLNTFIKLLLDKKTTGSTKILWKYITNILLYCDLNSMISQRDGNEDIKKVSDETFTSHDILHFSRDFSSIMDIHHAYIGPNIRGYNILYPKDITELLSDFGFSKSFQSKSSSYIIYDDSFDTEEDRLPFVFLKKYKHH